ncbi:MAG: diguanylate cyclase [Phycisphaerae bacterium]|nr:diguanylate cyclase [Phycisphaerae bacterium]
MSAPLENKDRPRAKKLLIVDDDPLQLALMTKYLGDTEFQILTAADGSEALRIVLSEEPRIIITDWFMPEMNGLDLCRALRQHEGVRFAYIVVTTSQGGDDKVVEALNSGADDFVRKPIKPTELIARLRAADRIVSAESDLAKRTREVHRINAEMALTHQKLKHANDQLRRMATTDELTGLLNRREAISRLEQLWAAYERYDQEFACITLDIDFFKRFNDSHGHAAGDLVLRAVAQVLRKCCRKSDLVCRVGGEEFLILCPGVGAKGAMVCAEHLRKAVESAAVEYEGTPLMVTISIGVSAASHRYGSPDELMKAADGALYQSKAAGRNRVTLAPDPDGVSVQAASPETDAMAPVQTAPQTPLVTPNDTRGDGRNPDPRKVTPALTKPV